jgi:histone deacetylase 11
LAVAGTAAFSCRRATTVSPESQQKATAVPLVYSTHFQINLAGLERSHPFDIHKYSKIARQLVRDGLLQGSDFRVPKELSREEMLLVHTPEYLESLKSPAAVARYLEAPLAAILPARLIDRGVLRAFRHASGGTILAGRLALQKQIAINLGGGYHHAKPDGGEGFCVYADIPIAVRLLQREKLIRRALVVDLDVHQGNGTAMCFRGDDSVFTFSMHQSDIYPVPKEKSDCDIELQPGTNDQTYLRVLRQVLPGVIGRSRPDLVVLQAGCDTLAGDPLADLCMTGEGIARRDGYVVETCVARGIPLAMTLGGGYSSRAWKVQYASIRGILETHDAL